MTLARLALLLFFGLPLPTLNAQNAEGSKPAALVGYVDCPKVKGEMSVVAFDDVCDRKVAEKLACGQQVQVLGREGPWVRLLAADGTQHWVGASFISQRKDKPVLFESSSTTTAPDCSFRPRTGTHPPQATYAPDPEYTDAAKKAHLNGTVQLSLVVGTDGHTQEIKVLKGLGKGLDEKAVEAVKQWKFRPAVKDGVPVPATITVEVDFRTY